MTSKTLAGPVLLFDGDCGFCSASIDWLRARRLLGYPARPWQRVPAGQLPVGRERLDNEVVLIRPGHPPVGGADALAAAVGAAPSRLRVVGAVVGRAPARHVARAVYRIIARNRHRMPGGTAACRLEP